MHVYYANYVENVSIPIDYWHKQSTDGLGVRLSTTFSLATQPWGPFRIKDDLYNTKSNFLHLGLVMDESHVIMQHF